MQEYKFLLTQNNERSINKFNEFAHQIQPRPTGRQAMNVIKDAYTVYKPFNLQNFKKIRQKANGTKYTKSGK